MADTIKEVTTGIPRYDRRFRYYESSGGIRVRTCRTWWKPFVWLGNRPFLRYDHFGYRYGKIHRWVRKNLTLD